MIQASKSSEATDVFGQASSDLSGPGFATEEAEELAVDMGVVIPGLRGTKKSRTEAKKSHSY